MLNPYQGSALSFIAFSPAFSLAEKSSRRVIHSLILS
jgi:hypothetical protein